jgi:hypothetical protein
MRAISHGMSVRNIMHLLQRLVEEEEEEEEETDMR